ncbi:hypothetical protein DM02DRAFT_677482 [Periconia macrospinosa]|uniref:Uncharacterized protein n=1 Tax=Periconia macrospinosa TaxID=97972 RepID=A0A2V1D4Q2_9PLEO|nr:hypothetical protein DM02DRAFT_677482 [Periconia macrospinosa]
MLSVKDRTGQAIVGAFVGLIALSQVQVPHLIPSKVFSRSFTAVKMSPALVENQVEIPELGNLPIGRAKEFKPKGSNGPTLLKGKPWGLPAGTYTPRQIVEANAPLLETVIHHLGPSSFGEPPAREQLIDNLASNLALNTRESSITIPANDPSRIELAGQAVNIGKKLIEYARNVTDVSYDPGYVVRSPCEGHLLKPHVSYLMFGPRSLRHLMQIYNEYLHQMVLLRDALLPFENFEEVVIPITDEPGRKRGMRHTEDARSAYLAEVMTKQVTQRSTIKVAQFLLAPGLSPANSIGFQYKYGTVVPAFIAGGTSGRLLKYVPAVVDDSNEEVVFHNSLLDYYAAPRTDVVPAEKDAAAGKTGEFGVTLLPEGKSEDRTLTIAIEYPDGAQSKVDLGQSARGYRYAQFARGKASTGAGNVSEDVQVHSARSLLVESGPGLVMPTKGVHVVQAATAIELYALLGKIYPDNVVVKEKALPLGAALSVGKEGLPDAGRFVIEVGK